MNKKVYQEYQKYHKLLSATGEQPIKYMTEPAQYQLSNQLPITAGGGMSETDIYFRTKLIAGRALFDGCEAGALL